MPEQGSTNPAEPQHSEGYGPAEHADDTRQSQHTQANDTPTDVNMNAVVARNQASTFALMQANFEANADRRNKIADQKFAKNAA